MTTATLPVKFVDYARNAGIVDDAAIQELFKLMRHATTVTVPAESITCESKRTADEYFGPIEVVKPKKTREPKAPKAPSDYRFLQAQCKELGIKANGTTEALRVRLNLHSQGILDASEYVKVKASKARAPKAAKENCFGLNYRQTQRLVSWFKSNMPANLLPADLAKNTGWANVKANAERCLTSHGWAAKLTDKQVQQMCDHCGIIDGDQLVTFLDESGLA